MKQHIDKLAIGLAIGSSVVGLVGVLCVGMMTRNALGNVVTKHADTAYRQQTVLAQKYGAGIDDHNARISKVEVRPNTGIILPKGKKTESLDSLEVAGADTRHIIQMKDGTMVYMIQPGDTLSSISATLGYSVDELANFNQIRNVNLIYANSALRIPKND
jgi:LysM repeat protein